MRFAMVVAVLVLAACGGSDGGGITPPPPTRKVAVMAVEKGQNQAQMASYRLPSEVVVRVMDSVSKLPLAGVQIVWTASGDGRFMRAGQNLTFPSDTSVTGADGRATVVWRLGRMVGSQNVTPTITSLPSGYILPGRPSGIRYADVPDSGITAAATTPTFFESNRAYVVSGDSPTASELLRVPDFTIPANTPVSFDSLVAVYGVRADSTRTSSSDFTFTIDTIRFFKIDASVPQNRWPSCTVNATARTFTCTPNCYATYKTDGPGLDPTKPFAYGSFDAIIQITDLTGATLHHRENQQGMVYNPGQIAVRFTTGNGCVPLP